MENFQRHIVSPDSLTLLFTGVFLLFGILKKAYAQEFSLFLRIPTSGSYFRVQRKMKGKLTAFNLLLVLAGSIVICIGIYSFLFAWGVVDKESFNWKVFIQLFTAYSAFLTVKFLLEKIVGEVFKIRGFMDKYLTFKLGIKNFWSFIAFPFLAIAVYFSNFNLSFLSLIAYIFIGMQIIFTLNFYLKKQKILTSHLFYFILYICAFEIAPYFIVFKTLL